MEVGGWQCRDVGQSVFIHWLRFNILLSNLGMRLSAALFIGSSREPTKEPDAVSGQQCLAKDVSIMIHTFLLGVISGCLSMLTIFLPSSFLQPCK